MPESGGRARWPLFPFAVLCWRWRRAQMPRNQPPYFQSIGSPVRGNLTADGGCESARVVVYNHLVGGVIGVNHY